MLLTRNWRLGVFEQNMLCGAMFRIYSSICFGIYLFIYLLLTTDTTSTDDYKHKYTFPY